MGLAPRHVRGTIAANTQPQRKTKPPPPRVVRRKSATKTATARGKARAKVASERKTKATP